MQFEFRVNFSSMRKNIAVILAGGSGSRMQLELPKQFLKVAGKSVLEHTVECFESHELVDEIVIVGNPAYKHLIKDYILKNGWKKVKKVLNGGSERYLSSWSAIRAFDNEEDVNLLFHDAVRPLVCPRIITENIQMLETCEAVDTAIPSPDTIIKLGDDLKWIDRIPEREYLWKGQTPQSFHLETIKKAYEIALKDPDLKTTDDCGVVRKYLPEVEICVVKGDHQNIKLTYKEDIYLLDKLFQLKSTRLGKNPDFDSLRKKVVVVFGGREGIGAEIVNICRKEDVRIYPFSRNLNDVDVSKPADVERALKEVYDAEGRIDVVINTAGLLNFEPLNTMDISKINELVDVNLLGVIYVAREAHPYLKETKGHLLFFTSSSHTRGRAFYSIYSSTKLAVVNFVQAIAAEWHPDHISVNCINPERTKTAMRIRNFGMEPDEILLKPEEVAMVSLGTICSNLNGQVIDVKVQEVE